MHVTHSDIASVRHRRNPIGHVSATASPNPTQAPSASLKHGPDPLTHSGQFSGVVVCVVVTVDVPDDVSDVVPVEVTDVVGVDVAVDVAVVVCDDVSVVVCDDVWDVVSHRANPNGQSSVPVTNGRQSEVAKSWHGPAVPAVHPVHSATVSSIRHRRAPTGHACGPALLLNATHSPTPS